MHNSAWNKLLEFETRDLIERYIQAKHNRKASARQIYEISSNFIQGREYFRNALISDITVKPLLQYYGVVALTKGLILATSPHIAESSIKPSHGLDTINWRESLTRKEFGNLTVSIKEGVFYQLLNSTLNKGYFKHNTNGINWSYYAPIPKTGTEFTLADLIQTLPDFKDEYKSWTQLDFPLILVENFKHNQKEGYDITVRKPKESNIVKVIFPGEIYDPYSITEEGIKLIIKTSKSVLPHISQHNGDPFRLGIGDIAFTKPINRSIYLSPIAQFYSLSFFLGMFCRYFPAQWISLGRTEKGDSFYPLLVKIIESIDLYFPLLVKEFLNGPYEFENK